MSRDEFIHKSDEMRLMLRRATLSMLVVMAALSIGMFAAWMVFQFPTAVFLPFLGTASLFCLLFFVPVERVKTSFLCPACKAPLYGFQGTHAQFVLANGCCGRCGATIIEDAATSGA